jgi:hypothetical protein
MTKLNKPFALGEVGPRTPNGNFDYSLWYGFIHKEKESLFIYFCLGQLQFKITLI